MTLFEEHKKYADDILFVMKNMESGYLGKNNLLLIDQFYGSTWVRYNGGDTVAHFTNESPHQSYSSINSTKEYIRHSQDGTGVALFINGEVKIINNDNPILTLTEEQHFQNSLIYSSTQLLILAVYSTLITHKFKYSYNMLSLNYVNILKKSMKESV